MSLCEEESLDAETQTHRGKGHVKTEIETGMMLLETKESRQPEARGEEGFFPGSLEPYSLGPSGLWPCQH